MIKKDKTSKKNNINTNSINMLSNVTNQKISNLYLYSTFFNIFILFIPVILFMIVDKYIYEGNIAPSNLFAISSVFILLAVISFLKIFSFNDLLKLINTEINNKIFDKIFYLPYNLLEQKKKSFWVSLFRDIDSIRNLLNSDYYTLKIDITFTTIFMGFLLGFLKFAGIPIVFLFLIYYAVIFFANHIDKTTYEKEKWIIKNRDDLVSDAIYNISEMKSLFLEDKIKAGWLGYQNIINEKFTKRNNRKNIFYNTGKLFLLSIFSIFIMFIFFKVKDNSITLGGIIASVFILWYLSFTLQKIKYAFQNKGILKESFERLEELFLYCDFNSKNQKSANNLEEENAFTAKELISFNNLSFNYNKKVILENANISFDLGNLYVFRNENNLYSSILFKAILGLYNIKSGQIIINNLNVSKLNKEKIANIVHYMPSENVLLDGSLRDNLSCHLSTDLTKLLKDDEKFITIEKAVSMFGLEKIIDDLSDGYETNLTDKTIISNSDARLINLARAFVGNPKIVLLEDPTKYLSRNQAIDVCNILHILSKDFLILISSNFLEFKNYAQLLTLENGQILPASDEMFEKAISNLKDIKAYESGASLSGFKKIKGAIFKKITHKKEG